MKRILGVLLALTLVLGLVPVQQVMAYDTILPYTEEEKAQFPEAGGEEDPQYFAQQEIVFETEDGAMLSGTAETKLAGAASFDAVTPRALRDGETLRRGIDVSQYQGDIDWKAVADAGIEFAFIRAGARGWGKPGTLMIDSTYEKNITEAQKYGIQVGAYIYSQAITEDEAREEAQHLMKLVAEYDLELPMVLDFEFASTGSGLGGRLYNANLSRREATDVCLAFCDEVQKYGYESLVYGNPSMLEGHIYPEELGQIWLAHYTKRTSYAGDYTFWQFSSSGQVSGISGDVDLNFWFDSGSSGHLTEPFYDVATGDWFFETVARAYQMGFVKGMTEHTFCPNEPMSRGQVATMLYRMAGSPQVTASAGFTDTTGYYQDAINWGWSQGIIKGYTDSLFGPDDNMAREDLFVLLYRYAGSPASSGNLSSFTDGDRVSDYARSAVAWAVETGLVNGYPDGSIQPRGNTTRAEACTILMRFQDLIG